VGLEAHKEPLPRREVDRKKIRTIVPCAFPIFTLSRKERKYNKARKGIILQVTLEMACLKRSKLGKATTSKERKRPFSSLLQ
jgi:hypothetical protein